VISIPDHISESKKTFIGLQILKFFDADADPGSGIFLTLDSDPGSGVEKFGSEMNIPDPQHCKYQGEDNIREVECSGHQLGMSTTCSWARSVDPSFFST
jgi:hypothetical protein